VDWHSEQLTFEQHITRPARRRSGIQRQQIWQSRVPMGVGYWLAASAITLLTGAMGCSCVG